MASIEDEIPRLRGVIHAVACPLLLFAGVVLAMQSETWRAGLAMFVMAVGYAAIFATSGIYHRRRWSPRVKRILRHLDHTMIFVGMACVYTALWLAVLDGFVANVMLAYVWSGVVVGALLKLKFLDARASRHSIAYVAFGLGGLVIVPNLFDRMPVIGAVLMLAGAFVFALGAVAFATQRPNPFPTLAGHHEIFHLATVIGACLHVAAMASVALG